MPKKHSRTSGFLLATAAAAALPLLAAFAPQGADPAPTGAVPAAQAIAAAPDVQAVPAVQAVRAAQAGQPPRLAVMIAVDQLRGDLLLRYDSLFTGGFRRLLDQGAYYTAATHDHAGTETGPGHATLGTGVYPSHSGIVANDFLVLQGPGWKPVYVVSDNDVRIVGYPDEQGRSPHYLKHTGFADWLEAARPTAKVFSVSGKDRAAILLAGEARGDVYWFDHGPNRFVTSTYYRKDYPAWLDSLQANVITPELAADTVWRNEIPQRWRGLAQPDSAPWEADGAHSAFPHTYAGEKSMSGRETFNGWLAYTPYIDGAVLQVAEKALTAEGLGQDTIPDYLAISLSQTDYVGHTFGPLSQEQLDNLLRLDRELGAFFDSLDAHVGKGNWVVAFSADHGVLTQPEIRQQQGEPGQRITGSWRKDLFDAAAAAKGTGPVTGGRERAAEALERFPYVADAITYDELRGGAPADSFVTLYRHSFMEGRPTDNLGVLGVTIRPKEGTLLTYSSGGTSHGTPYWYDRWVPVAFLGDGVPAERIDRRIATVDVAATLAAITNTPAPKDLDGKPLPEVVGAKKVPGRRPLVGAAGRATLRPVRRGGGAGGRGASGPRGGGGGGASGRPGGRASGRRGAVAPGEIGQRERTPVTESR